MRLTRSNLVDAYCFGNLIFHDCHSQSNTLFLCISTHTCPFQPLTAFFYPTEMRLTRSSLNAHCFWSSNFPRLSVSVKHPIFGTAHPIISRTWPIHPLTAFFYPTEMRLTRSSLNAHCFWSSNFPRLSVSVKHPIFGTAHPIISRTWPIHPLTAFFYPTEMRLTRSSLNAHCFWSSNFPRLSVSVKHPIFGTAHPIISRTWPIHPLTAFFYPTELSLTYSSVDARNRSVEALFL
ncbi:hypothetical protein DM01DRAFT_1146447 [Hesseltinella vesiculosa]|uniref:Uncharacterized protein n=1 Tax=Hesseltinella vesiculosa TaxID=101127 RepID=A0A1X2G6Z7_9FUNG|nr:hypothetical protein DM01DRAFT_1146447 [Hesseltinella vesiculosa]